MVTVVQGKVCAKNHHDRLSRLATIHQRYRRTDGRISYGIGLDLTVGQKLPVAKYSTQRRCKQKRSAILGSSWALVYPSIDQQHAMHGATFNKKLIYCSGSISDSGRSAVPNCNPEYDLCKLHFIDRVVNTWSSVPSRQTTVYRTDGTEQRS